MSKRKAELLGMPFGTAAARLRKAVMFMLISRLGLNTCYRCGQTIETVDELSMEHKEHWQGAADPKAAFFDLTNIAFSHFRCNARSKQTNRWTSKTERDAHWHAILNPKRTRESRRAEYARRNKSRRDGRVVDRGGLLNR